jgi:hypothetical protein
LFQEITLKIQPEDLWQFQNTTWIDHLTIRNVMLSNFFLNLIVKIYFKNNRNQENIFFKSIWWVCLKKKDLLTNSKKKKSVILNALLPLSLTWDSSSSPNNRGTWLC